MASDRTSEPAVGNAIDSLIILMASEQIMCETRLEITL